jgi:hypothetical protein
VVGVYPRWLLGALALSSMSISIACGQDGNPAPGSPTPARLAENTPDPDAWLTFNSDENQFSIRYLKSWTVEAAASTGAKDIFKSPGFGMSDSTLVVIEFGESPEISADDPAFAEGVRDGIRTTFDAEPNILGVFPIGGLNGLLLDWESASGGERGYALQAWIPNHGQGWIISMTTAAATKEDYIETFRQMLDSFEPKE